MTLLHQFEARVHERPGNIAVHDRGVTCTYGELSVRSQRLAAWLQEVEVYAGDRVVLLLPNCIDDVACCLGVLRAGAVVVALNPQATADELAYTLRDAGPKVVITISKGTELLSRALRCGEAPSLDYVVTTDAISMAVGNGVLKRRTLDEASGSIVHSAPLTSVDLAQIIDTSGTTGRPKGMMLTHANIRANGDDIIGRNNDTIKSGAYRIHPGEIEDVLAEVPGIAEAAAVSVPDDIWGERPVAFVVPPATAGDNIDRLAREHCRIRLPRYKQPREVRLIERLPRTASGKVRGTVLRNGAAVRRKAAVSCQ